LRTRPLPDHVVIEASGISEPLGIAETLFQPELEALLRVEAMVAVCDAAAYPELDFENTEMVLRQTAVADLVILNKTDIASPAALAQLRQDVGHASPQARLVEAVQARLPMTVLFGPESTSEHRRRHLHGQHQVSPGHDAHHHATHEHADEHSTRFGTWSWTHREPLNLPAFQEWVRQLPPTLYRAKGILRLAGQPDREAVFQLVGKRSTLELGGPWRSAPGNELVLIGASGAITSQQLAEALNACLQDQEKASRTAFLN
jgi:G3E family GTPase